MSSSFGERSHIVHDFIYIKFKNRQDKSVLMKVRRVWVAGVFSWEGRFLGGLEILCVFI